MDEKDEKQLSYINEKGNKLFSKRDYISKNRYLVVLLKAKSDDSSPDNGSSCPLKCK